MKSKRRLLDWKSVLQTICVVMIFISCVVIYTTYKAVFAETDATPLSIQTPQQTPRAVKPEESECWAMKIGQYSINWRFVRGIRAKSDSAKSWVRLFNEYHPSGVYLPLQFYQDEPLGYLPVDTKLELPCDNVWYVKR